MRNLKHYTMRKFFTLLLLVAAIPVLAQQYNNEWINYSQTYYKLKVGTTGLYRIPKAVLDNSNIGSTPVQFFELWRNGQKVPFYPSVPTGILPANGYIEFWGEINDGKADRPLYRDTAYQHTTKHSIISDTAFYFLSINTNQSGFIVSDVVNNVAGNALPAEPYFMHKEGSFFRTRMNPGFAAVVGEYVYSSSYDKGEFWSSGEIRPVTPLTTSLADLYVENTGPASRIKFGAVGNALNPRTVRIKINGNVVADTLMDYFNDVNGAAGFSTSLINSSNATVEIANTSPIPSDRMVVSYFEMTYPRQFNFGGKRNFEFELPAKASGYYLEIKNFNYGTTAPVLYDVNSGERYTGDINTSGTVKFAIPGSANPRKLVLANTESANIIGVSSLAARNFVQFNDVNNQGNYLIITHPSLYIGSTGNNPVEDYKNYRASVTGGSHNVKVVDINELVDQFGYGIKKHPLSVKNFLRFARKNFAAAPNFVLLMGKGMNYYEYKRYESDPQAERLNLVPTFGLPASDNLLSADGVIIPIPATPIGRLSVINAKELEDYLEKIKEYENAQKNAPNTIAGRDWMKNIVHVTGSSDPYLGTVLCNYMSVYKQIIEDTLFGGKVSTFCKTSTNPVEQLTNERIQDLFAEGISILTYFGHSSSTTLEFNLDNPQSYSNQGKYPVFFVNGCNAGNFFTFNTQRLIVNETLSEKFVLAKQRGSIAFVASTHYGIVNYLNLFLNHLYTNITHVDYGKSLGELCKNSLQRVIDVTGQFDYYARMHAEEITLHGDPALKLNAQAKPDYIIEEPLIKINPAFISIAENSFKLGVKMLNIGKAINDSITIEVKRQFPDGSFGTIYKAKRKGIYYVDSLSFDVPIIATRDKGLNKIIVTVDADLNVDEMAENNNMASKEFFIFEDEARTVYPYNFSIVNNASQKVFASSANPFSTMRDYVMEMDTTELFNSSSKITKTISTTGGVLEFTPGINYRDSTVYYWRVSSVPPAGGQYRWNTSSFIFIPGNIDGYNQSHFFQHQKSTLDRIKMDSARRQWLYGERINNLFIRNTMYPTGGVNQDEFSVAVNGQAIIMSACVGRSLIFNIFDPITFKPWKNVDANGNNLFRYGSAAANCGGNRYFNFEFSYMNTASRKRMMDFMDSIPANHFVVVRSFDYNVIQSYSSTWRGDTAIHGSNNSLYHKLLGAGFNDIDSVNKPRAWIFVYKKSDNSFTPVSRLTAGIYDRVNLAVDCLTPDSIGYITSPKFGPAKQWQEVIWRGNNLEMPSDDNPTVEIIGVDSTGVETTLYNLDKNTQNFDVSSVNPIQYPYMKLRMRNVDSVKLSPYQLNYWRIHYVPVPEGALAPNVFLTSKDTLDVGEPFKFAIAFKNVSKAAFDSLVVKAIILDRNNVPHVMQMPKHKPLINGDTITIRFEVDTKEFPEMNTIFVDVNPDNNQPEQYHFNNFLYRNFYVRPDKINPLLDVTFDGVHILNRDIVSARPHIQIKLKDEAKFLLLNDTALSSVHIRFPDGTLREYEFDNDTLRFTPATSGADNTATLDFYPAFIQQVNPEGDEYELIVKGKDRSNNKAGEIEYRVTFRVITKPMISNLLNYPNPFSTSTAFVFTVTGTEVPQNIKIQILTVTGKIVREITKDELGPLHIGRNITEFKWNGTDQYGQKLGNGVYLYRVVTTLNGRPMDKYKTEGDDTDKYFTNGYGKMYFMR